MNSTHPAIHPRDVLETIIRHPLQLAIPAVALALVALAYALTKPATWEVSQALVVRDEAGDRLTRPGKFTHADEMKITQETILELAKSRNVLTRALVDVGPPADRESTIPWPSEKEIEDLQGRVKISPPKGAEFGKTEVFYLKVQDSSAFRATDLAVAICRELQNRFCELREAKAQSTVNELGKAVELARTDLDTSTKALGDIERSVSRDLAELRILNEAPSGDSDLRRTATDLEKELRTYRGAQAENQEFRKVLSAAQNDPDKLLASPSELLRSQPSLGRLKDGLVDAQLRTGQLQGTMSENHPLVRAARAAEQAIRRQLHDEIGVALRGVEIASNVNADRIKTLEEQEAALRDRFDRLASVRAEYANLVTATKNHGETFKSIDHELSEARASKIAARTASLINLIDTPDAGTRPLGPSRSMIVLVGLAGGLMIGVAFSFLHVERRSETEPIARQAIVYPVASAAHEVGSAAVKQIWQRLSKYRVYSPSAVH